MPICDNKHKRNIEMIIVSTVAEVRNHIEKAKAKGQKVGFVPTMGALHNGHLQLVSRSVSENDFTVVSVFVNPTQFNDPKDLEKYPRTLDADCALLDSVSCNLVFAPSVQDIYPEPDTRLFCFAPLDTVMEGKFRPGHFNGVAQVVSRLFDIVTPDIAYFGEKDFQQLAIIRRMVKDLNYNIEIIGCPIVRQADGLALSSRNTLLSKEELAIAPEIRKVLSESKNRWHNQSLQETLEQVKSYFETSEQFRLDYFEIVDGNTLQPIADKEDTDYAVGCIAVFLGSVRLIDNITYTP